MKAGLKKALSAVRVYRATWHPDNAELEQMRAELDLIAQLENELEKLRGVISDEWARKST